MTNIIKNSKVPTSNILLAFDEDSVRYLLNGNVNFTQLKNSVDYLNKNSEVLKAYLFGAGATGNILEFVHEFNFSDNSTDSGTKASYFRLKIIDPKNEFEHVFVSNVAKGFDKEELKQLLKDQKEQADQDKQNAVIQDYIDGLKNNKYHFNKEKTILYGTRKVNPLINVGDQSTRGMDQFERYVPGTDENTLYYGESLEDYELTRDPNIIKKVLDGKIIKSKVGNKLKSCYIAYGVGNNFNEWAGPFVATFIGADYTYQEDGARILSLEFLSTNGNALGRSRGIPEIEFVEQNQDRFPLYKVLPKTNNESIFKTKAALEKVKNNITTVKTDTTSINQKIDEINAQILDLSSRADVNSNIISSSIELAKDTKESFLTYLFGADYFPGNNEDLDYLNEFYATNTTLGQEFPSGQIFAKKFLSEFEDNTFFPQDLTNIQEVVEGRAYKILVDKKVSFEKYINELGNTISNLLIVNNSLNNQIFNLKLELEKYKTAKTEEKLVPNTNYLQLSVSNDTNKIDKFKEIQNEQNNLDDILNGISNEFYDLDFLIWQAVTSYLNTYLRGKRRTLFMIPSVYAIIPDYIARVKREVETRFTAKLLPELTKTPNIDLTLEIEKYKPDAKKLITLATYVTVLSDLGFDINYQDDSKNGLLPLINWETANRSSKTIKEQVDTSILQDNIDNLLNFYYNSDKSTSYIPYVCLRKPRGKYAYESILTFFKNLNSYGIKQYKPMWTYEYNYKYIKFFEEMFGSDDIIDGLYENNYKVLDTRGNQSGSEVLIVGDFELIYQYLYFPEIKSAQSNINDYIQGLTKNKNKLNFAVGDPWKTIFSDLNIPKELPSLPTGGTFGDIYHIPDEYAIKNKGQLNSLSQIASIPIFRYGTSNPNVLRFDFDLKGIYTRALRTIQSIAPLRGFISLIDSKEIDTYLDPKSKFIKDLTVEDLRLMVERVIESRRSLGSPTYDKDNIINTNLEQGETIKELFKLLNTENLNPEEFADIISLFVILLMDLDDKELPVRFGEIFTNNALDAQVMEIIRIISNNILKGTIYTLPIFKISNIANAFSADCVFINREPRIISTKVVSQPIDSILTGQYKIIGFRHEITNNKCQSAFHVYKRI